MPGSQKTLPSGADVDAFIAAVPDDTRRDDARTLCGLLAKWTGEQPATSGPARTAQGR